MNYKHVRPNIICPNLLSNTSPQIHDASTRRIISLSNKIRKTYKRIREESDRRINMKKCNTIRLKNQEGEVQSIRKIKRKRQSIIRNKNQREESNQERLQPNQQREEQSREESTYQIKSN